MNDAVRRFRDAAARENRGRRLIRRRYSQVLQREAVGYCQRQAAEGVGVRAVAVALGVAPWSLHRWMRRHRSGQPRFHRVKVVAPTRESAAPGLVVVVTANGPRVEGLDVETAARLLALLR